jgi:hypothetical protein
LKIIKLIPVLLILYCLPSLCLFGQNKDTTTIHFDFYGDPIEFTLDKSFVVDFTDPPSERSIYSFYQRIEKSDYTSVLNTITSYKKKHRLDDWLYYQLIRKTAQQISPKAANYKRYTLYKWFLLIKSGYDALLTFAGDQLLFYIRSDENIYNIPTHIHKGKQYVCLNFHDYKNIDFEKDKFSGFNIEIAEAKNTFSYKITQLPEFRSGDYLEKDIRFNYYDQDNIFKVRLNPEIKTIFANYPVVDYESYFNIPLSHETYKSLIPLLKKRLKGLSKKNGVDYLMRFTRNAFVFEPDSTSFGAEKRLSPEQTLLYDYSDCEDRAALFFYLVKEIYDLPMIVLVFPRHVTVAVKLEKPVGKPITHNGVRYTVCEPTPQREDLNLGELMPEYTKASYEIAYVYMPGKR